MFTSNLTLAAHARSARARAAQALFIGALLGFAAASQASGSSDPLDKSYQCVVAGQSSACGTTAPLTTAVRTEERLVPGPLAAYAMHTGVAKDEAIASARAQGEYPTRQLLRISARKLTPAEEWQRVNGAVGLSREKIEVLSSAPDLGPATLSQRN